jgi:translation initiation factor 2 beta subunit (eIF-2beta)/eIF-5
MEDNEQKLTLEMDENELYVYLLEDIYDTLDKNSNLFVISEIKVAKPEARFDITKKTIWSNFRSICQELKTGEEQLANFFAKEYSATLSINQEGHLLIKGRYSELIIGSALKKYIRTFLQCVACKTLNTSVERKANKLTYLVCHNEKCKLEKVIKYSL